MNARELEANECRVEEKFRSPEALRRDLEDAPVRQLVVVLQQALLLLALVALFFRGIKRHVALLDTSS